MVSRNQYLRKIIKIFKYSIFAILITLLVSACSPANNNDNENVPQEDSQPSHPNDQTYRMFFDGESIDDIQIRQFTGQLLLPKFEDMFKEVTTIEEDEDGNFISGPVFIDGHVWYMKMSPSKNSVNLISVSPDGTTSSAMDVDGDGVADSVDILGIDGKRFTFLTEAMGLRLLDEFLNGRNPWCDDNLVSELGLEKGFGCGDESNSDSSGAPGGGVGGFAGTGLIDPMDMICSGYDTGNRGKILGLANPRALIYSSTNTFIDRGDHGTSTIVTNVQTTEGTTVEHVRTTRIIYNYDGDGDLIQRINESVDANGDGTRTITNYEDGAVSNVILPAPFKAKLNPDQIGQYDSNESTPPPESPYPEDSEESRHDERTYLPDEQPSDADVGTDSNPGPDGDDSSIASFCGRRGQVSGGVEGAASTDPSVMGVSCGDLVGAPSSDDCIIIEWANPENFAGAVAPSSGNNCGPFEQPDDEGNCSGASIAEKLRGLTAIIATLNLKEVVICPPIVCNPAEFAESNQRQEISAPASEPQTDSGNTGVIPTATLCYTGPSANYVVVSSLNSNIEVTVIGTSSVDGWLLINNPVFDNVSCWLENNKIDLSDEYDFGNLQEYPVPPLEVDPPSDGDGNNTDGDSNTPQGPEDCAENEYWSIETETCEIFG